ncbi:AMP-binding protein [Dongia sp.]|uniref:AMP-binding protein n=1 Tax=Dongia sp. TaxID=1977262 RepID=UPI003752D64F
MFFADHLGRFGDAPALLSDADGMVTYGELAARVDRAAHQIGGRQLILASARLDIPYIVAYLAALKARCPIIAAGPTPSDIEAIFRPSLRLTDQGFAATEAVAPDLHPDLALLLSTSGSMGSPKLVRLSRANLQANAESIAQFLEFRADDRGLLSLPLHYSYGLSVLHSHLAVGASLYVAAQPIVAPGFLDAVAEAGCTNIAGVPHSFALFEEIGLRRHALPALRFMTVAGGALAPDLVRDYARFMQRRGGRFFVMYGQTEATARMAYLPPDAALTHPDHIGIAIPGGRFELVDESGAAIDRPGETGELVYAGPNVMMGYAETRAALALGSTLDRLETGDLATRSPEGYFRIAGRSARFSKIAGLRISHDELERRLRRHGHSTAVTGDDARILVALEGRAALADLRDAIAREAAIPADRIRIAACDALPRTATAKIDYPAVARLVTEAAAVLPMAAKPIQEAYAATFFPRRVRREDSFNSLGGDSLAHVQIALALEQKLGRLPEDWESTSIADLAAKPAPKPGAWRHLDAAHLLRAGAVLLVALHHATLWPIPGGAATLLVLVGWSLARFQAPRLFAGKLGPMLRAMAANLLLYLPIVVVYCIATDRFLWPSLLLIGNTGIAAYQIVGDFLWTYWFVEAYAQTLLLTAGLFLIAPLRRWIAAHPLAAGLIATALALPLRHFSPAVWDAGAMKNLMTTMVLYMPALGWAICFAETRRAKAALSLVAVAVAAFILFTGAWQALALWIRAGVLAGACLLLIWRVRLLLPGLLAGMLRRVSAASYHIYLVHTIPMVLLFDGGELDPTTQALRFSFGVAAGLLFYHLDRALRRQIPRSLQAFATTRRRRPQAAE